MTMKFIMTSGAVVVNKENKILLKRDPKRGWELPGGQVEQNETIKETVIREVKEETGIDIELIKFCGISQEKNRDICNFWWLGTPISSKFCTSSESLEVGFFDVKEALILIKNEDFKEELLHCLSHEGEPFFLSF
ncbi:NUDIX hydrolase [Viridibacillus sp. YIM B01967]|uniref:NUDIX hydrolase n=1 Tax=Viridibacillus soli TaxID=2798301 RepID=A0ABS1HAC1_9BACL|nr:NUDIX hydrolase [Viridibacillus soli]MBK3496374.1 NUDIX hydrolase [Viridibacillus soli]